MQRVTIGTFPSDVLPEGFFRIGEIERATKNLLLGKVDLLPKRAKHTKIKVDRMALLEGIACYLVRLLLCPNPIGGPELKGPLGNTYLWHNGQMLAFDDDETLASGVNNQRVSISDFLFLDEEPFLPLSLEGGIDDDDAFAYFSSMVRNQMLCMNPSTWAVRNKPQFSLDNIDEYARQSGSFSRWDFELQFAREAWERAEPFSGAKLFYSFPRTGKNPPFKRPSEIAKLLEKEFRRLSSPPKNADSLARIAVEKFREVSESDQSSFTYEKIAIAMGYQSNQTDGSLFRTALARFKSLLTDKERGRLPKAGRRSARPD